LERKCSRQECSYHIDKYVYRSGCCREFRGGHASDDFHDTADYSADHDATAHDDPAADHDATAHNDAAADHDATAHNDPAADHDATAHNDAADDYPRNHAGRIKCRIRSTQHIRTRYDMVHELDIRQPGRILVHGRSSEDAAGHRSRP
jgi:hypothetical protein